MNQQQLTKDIKHLRVQRNLLGTVCLLLAFSLAAGSCFLFLKQERTIVVPATVEKSFWVESNAVSATYVEQFGVFLGQLLLNKSHQSSGKQREILLRHSTPSFRSALNMKLIEEEKRLKKQTASYVFYPTEVEVGRSGYSARLIGDRAFYVGGKRVSSKREAYVLTFAWTGGRLLLEGVESVDEKES